MVIDAGQGRTRRDQAVDGAIAVIAESGLRGLTHRAVDTRAHLPPGSTSSCFRTRKALVDGVLVRILELDEATLDRMPAGWWRSAETAAESLTWLLETWLGEGRQRTRARMVLHLDASLAQSNASWYEGASLPLLERATAGFEEAGFSRPRHAANLFIAQLDGLLFGALTRPFHGEVDRAWLREGVEAVLRSLSSME